MRVLFQVARHDRAGRGARIAFRLVAGGALLLLAACVLAPWLGNAAAAMLLLFGGPLYLIVLYDLRRARERDEARRRDRLRRTAIEQREAAIARHDARNAEAVAEMRRRAREAGR